MHSILVIRLSSLGDVILATGLVRQLHQSMPDVAIDVAVDSRFAEVWAHNPRVRNVFSVDRATRRSANLAELAVHAPYDVVVDLQRNRRSKKLIASMHLPSSTQVRAVSKHRIEKLALVWLKRRPATVTPVTRRYWNTVSHLGVEYDHGGPEVWTPDGLAVTDTQRTLIALAPGARHATKRWPAERFAELARRLVLERSAHVVLLGGPDDAALCSQIESLAGVPLLRADGATDLATTVATLDRCRVVVSNDSAVMHLARGRRIPVVAIFGSTVQELGFAPSGPDVRIIERLDVPCRPCSHIGRDACPKGHFRCMVGIAADDVIAAIDEVSRVAP